MDGLCRIIAWYDSRGPTCPASRRVVASLLAPATTDEIDKLRRVVGGRGFAALPDDVIAFYRVTAGQRMPEAGHVTPGLLPWSADLCAHELIPIDDVPNHLSDRDGGYFGYRTGWLPIARNGFGDYIVVDLRNDSPEVGRVLEFSHDWRGVHPVGRSLTAYTARLADELVAGTLIFDDEAESLCYPERVEVGEQPRFEFTGTDGA